MEFAIPTNNTDPTRRKKIEFLDLPAEIHLQIYEHLLINRSPASNGNGGEMHTVQIVDSHERRENGYGPYARYHEGNGNGLVPARAERNSANYIHATILRTCRKIADEGSHFLYSTNTFAINLSRESFAPTYRLFRDGDCYLVNPIRNMFEGGQSRSYLAELSYVAFFQQIGVQNTNTIQHLQIFANDTVEYSIAMPLLTEVVRQHVPKLKTVVFYLIANHDDNRSYDRAEYANYISRAEPILNIEEDFNGRNSSEVEFDPDNPERATGHFRPMYTALDEFSKKITSLDALKYRGHWHFTQEDLLGTGFDCRWSMMITDSIESQVKDRSRERKTLLENLKYKETNPPAALNTRLLRWRDYEEEYTRLSRRFRPVSN